MFDGEKTTSNYRTRLPGSEVKLEDKGGKELATCLGTRSLESLRVQLIHPTCVYIYICRVHMYMYVDTDTCVYMCAHIWIMYTCIVHM